MDILVFLKDLLIGGVSAMVKELWAIVSTPAVGVLLLLFVFGGLQKWHRYRKSAYAAVTHNPYLRVMRDTGLRGEYEIWRRLSSLEKQGGRFLFNLYLPKEDGETTEADVLLILPAGIFVFESKNYSGWIFGDGQARMWTQTLPRGKGKGAEKEHFYNPLRQNAGHIRALRALIGEEIPMWSVIVFSERCTLKSIRNTENVPVIRRTEIDKTVKQLADQTGEKRLSEEEIAALYDRLYPFSQVNQQIKSQHIERIRQKRG